MTHPQIYLNTFVGWASLSLHWERTISHKNFWSLKGPPLTSAMVLNSFLSTSSLQLFPAGSWVWHAVTHIAPMHWALLLHLLPAGPTPALLWASKLGELRNNSLTPKSEWFPVNPPKNQLQVRRGAALAAGNRRDAQRQVCLFLWDFAMSWLWPVTRPQPPSPASPNRFLSFFFWSGALGPFLTPPTQGSATVGKGYM